MRFVGPEEGQPTVHVSCAAEFLAPAETPVWKWYAYSEILRRNSWTFEKNLLHR